MGPVRKSVKKVWKNPDFLGTSTLWFHSGCRQVVQEGKLPRWERQGWRGVLTVHSRQGVAQGRAPALTESRPPVLSSSSFSPRRQRSWIKLKKTSLWGLQCYDFTPLPHFLSLLPEQGRECVCRSGTASHLKHLRHVPLGHLFQKKKPLRTEGSRQGSHHF